MVLPPRLRVAIALSLVIVTFLLAKSVLFENVSTFPSISKVGGSTSFTGTKDPISYDKSTPPSVGCEDVVHKLQLGVLEHFSRELKGIRYANIFGYLGQTENKGDAVIWIAQDILLATLGIKTMEVCRYVDKDCDIEKFGAALEAHAPHSAVIMAGGGNFNDFFMDDHPARLKMAKMFKQYPLRAFPQSINMTKPDMIKQTAEVFGDAEDIQLAARDQPSFDFLQQTFGDRAVHTKPNKVKHILTPDVAFMFGSRPDIRKNTKKT